MFGPNKLLAVSPRYWRKTDAKLPDNFLNNAALNAKKMNLVHISKDAYLQLPLLGKFPFCPFLKKP